MFADPTTVTVATVAKACAAISRENNKSVYRNDDGEFTLTISRSNGARNRHLVRIDHEKVAANPVDSTNAEVKAAVYVVMDVPDWGFTATQVADLVTALGDFLTSANVAKVVAGET